MVLIVKGDIDGLIAASKVVADGGIISYPTDTVYGLGCDPFSPDAIRRVMKAKGDRRKPLPVLVKTLQDGEKIADFSEKAIKLVQKFWPGPLTMVLKAKAALPTLLAPYGTVGVRSPKHPTCRSLLGLCSGHLIGTSANRTGEAPATTAEEVARSLGDLVDVVVDGGKTSLGVASTVIDLSNNPVVLREGPIPREVILKYLRNVR